jgi:hypothetical protein
LVSEIRASVAETKDYLQWMEYSVRLREASASCWFLAFSSW